jgi:hypothetical protein
VTVTNGTWVRRDKNKYVRRLEGEEADKRRQIRTEAERLRTVAIATMTQSHFGLAEANLRRAVQEIAERQGFETMPTEGYESLTDWAVRAKAVIERFTAVEQELKTLEARQGSGEVRVDFGGHFRVMGATGNAQYWVIRPDGSERDPDEVNYRKRWTSEGDKRWRLVGPEELAIMWSKSCTAADHEFVVAKLPAGECTAEQLATVEHVEREISERFDGATGMSGATSPSIGAGWDLRTKAAPQSKLALESSAPKGEALSADALAGGLDALRARFSGK